MYASTSKLNISKTKKAFPTTAQKSGTLVIFLRCRLQRQKMFNAAGYNATDFLTL
jgi:hypothetical protein